MILVLSALVLAGLVMAGLVMAGWVLWQARDRQVSSNWQGIQTVNVPEGRFDFHPSGIFHLNGQLADPPQIVRTTARNLRIMKYHVSEAQYAQCVAAGGCDRIGDGTDNNTAQVGVSYLDAVAYAQWLSETSGQTWRLPSDAEWVRAAGEKFAPALVGVNAEDPSKRWIAEYRAKSSSRNSAKQGLRPAGSYGENELGVADMSASVWDWTSTCLRYGSIHKSSNRFKIDTEFCGRRVAQGQHRAYIVVFVRDPSAGGCGGGLPPDFLGIRLIREL